MIRKKNSVISRSVLMARVFLDDRRASLPGGGGQKRKRKKGRPSTSRRLSYGVEAETVGRTRRFLKYGP